MVVTKALTLTVVKVIMDDGLFEEVKKAFSKRVQDARSTLVVD